MSNRHIRNFISAANETSSVLLPFPFEDLIESWSNLRRCMLKGVPDGFSRDEWAYLISFLDSQNLWEPFVTTFGAPLSNERGLGTRVYYGRGLVAVWLPNNVSLLGPLLLILLSLTGNPLQFKAGTRSRNVVEVLRDFALKNLQAGALRDYLAEQVSVVQFDRNDPRNSQLAKEAAIRIVFGSDNAAAKIHALAAGKPSVGFSFIDRQSQIWISPESINEEVLSATAKTFAIYGRAGCTSPQRVVIIDGTPELAREVRDRLASLWPRVIRAKTEAQVASANVLAEQWAKVLGWETVTAFEHGAVLASGPADIPLPDGNFFLPVISESLGSALRTLPANIQTIGVAAPSETLHQSWMPAFPPGVSRVVPISAMHHFGATWDGEEYWRSCFSCALFENGNVSIAPSAGHDNHTANELKAAVLG